MGGKSRTKGKGGERELAAELTRLLGCAARRGVQYSGGPDSPDVVIDIPGLHIECKRKERLSLYAALDQAERDAGEQKLPVVMHRSNRRPWVAIVRLDDLMTLAKTLVAGSADSKQDADPIV